MKCYTRNNYFVGIRLNLNRYTLRAVFASMIVLVSACANLSQSASQNAPAFEPEQPQINALASQQNPVADATYALMVAEIALNQGETALAVQYYLEVAKSQDNPAIAERAVRVAVYGQDLEAAVEAAQEKGSIALEASGAISDDGIIDPRDTRTALGICLSVVRNKPVLGTDGYGVFRL